jgi:hypothetical protein
VAVACACLLLLPLAGCAEAATSAPTSSPPTPTPVFASDEEALAAATAAYANYQAMADQITGDGGKAPERIAKFVSEEYLPDEVQQYEGYRDANARSVGNTAFVVKSVQRLDYSDSSLTAISLYICDDVSGVEVFDENGASLVSESRKAVTPFEVEFVLNSEGILVIDSRDVWEQTNFC